MINPDEVYNITNIVKKSILQGLPDAFFAATGVTSGIHDLSGELITTIPQENFCAFCRNMFYNEEGHARCTESNRYGAEKALKNNGPFIYQCHAGLIDVAVPIIFEGTHIGTVSCGQLLMTPLTDEIRNRVRRRLAGMPEEFIELQIASLEDVQYLPYERVEAISVLLQSIANEIIYLLIKNIQVKETNKKTSYLIEDIKKRASLENEIKNAELKIKEAELKILEAQINPHFLYNTLDSIQWMAIISGNDQIQDMIQSLSQVLRYSLMRGQPVVNLEDEIQNIESYLRLQQVRFRERLEYQIDVDPSFEKLQTPKLTLQPLVENALKYGISPSEKGGNLWIRTDRTDSGEVRVSVSNDGMVMSDEQVKQVRGLLEPHGTISRHEVNTSEGFRVDTGGIGLQNVHERMRYYFGDDYGLSVSNTDNKTTFSFLIPQTIRRL